MSNIFKLFAEIGFFLSLMVNAALFVPQAIKLYKAKTSKGISFITFFGFNIIQAFTAAHAFLVNDVTLLIGSLLAFITCGAVTYFSFIYRNS